MGGYEESVNVRAVDLVGALGGRWCHLPSGWVHLYETSSSVWGLAKLGGFPKHSSGVGTWTFASGVCSGGRGQGWVYGSEIVGQGTLTKGETAERRRRGTEPMGVPMW